MTEMHPVTLDDVPAIMTALLALQQYSPAFQMRYADPVTAEAYLRQAIGEGRGWRAGGYFVMVDPGSDWYSPTRYLIEQIILKVWPDDKSWHLDTVVRLGLPFLKDYYGCEAIVVGDTQIGYMTQVYLRHGYTALGTQLMKGA
jgi:hypothetical protein